MRRLARLVLVVLIATVTGLYPLVAPTPHRIDQAHFEMIQAGMTRTDVEAIFGVPPGQYDWAEADIVRLWDFTTGQQKLSSDWAEAITFVELDPRKTTVNVQLFAVMGFDLPRGETWVSRHGTFALHFDAHGRWTGRIVTSAHVVPPWKRWWGLIWK
jgi:hypothetical protein